jgi:hypothetical protein
VSAASNILYPFRARRWDIHLRTKPAYHCLPLRTGCAALDRPGRVRGILSVRSLLYNTRSLNFLGGCSKDTASNAGHRKDRVSLVCSHLGPDGGSQSAAVFWRLSEAVGKLSWGKKPPSFFRHCKKFDLIYTIMNVSKPLTRPRVWHNHFCVGVWHTLRRNLPFATFDL